MIYEETHFSPNFPLGDNNDDRRWNIDTTQEHEESLEEATHRIEEKFDETVMSLSEDQKKFEAWQVKRNKLLAYLREQHPEDFRQYKLYDLLAGGLEPKHYIHFDFPQPYTIEDFVNDPEGFELPASDEDNKNVDEITADRMRDSIDKAERR